VLNIQCPAARPLPPAGRSQRKDVLVPITAVVAPECLPIKDDGSAKRLLASFSIAAPGVIDTAPEVAAALHPCVADKPLRSSLTWDSIRFSPTVFDASAPAP